MLQNIINWLNEIQRNMGQVAVAVLGIVAVICGMLALIQAINCFRKNDYKKGAMFLAAAIIIGIIIAIGVMNALEVGKAIAPNLMPGGGGAGQWY